MRVPGLPSLPGVGSIVKRNTAPHKMPPRIVDRATDRPAEYPQTPVQNTRAMVAKEQAFLKARGYNIIVDGIRGPRTISALQDWHKGVGGRNPQVWSQKVAPVDEVRPTAKTKNNTQPPKGVPGSVTPTHGKNSFYMPVPPKTGTQKPVQTGKGRPNLPGVPTSNAPGGSQAFDVDVLANAAMEAKYGPVLAEYLRQEKNIGNMADNRVAEIGDMYGKYTGDIKNRNVEAAALRGSMATATAGLTPAIAQGVALDADAATQLAARGDIESDYAAQMNTSAGDMDRRMATAAQSGGVFAAAQERGEAAGKIGELGAERKDTLAQRGADLVATRQALTEWQADQYFKQQGLDLERQSAQAGMADAATKNAIAIAELKAANAMLPLEAQKTAAELQRLYADIEHTNAQTQDILNPRPDPADTRAATKDAADAKTRNDTLRINTLNAMTSGTRFGETGGGAWRLPMNKNWARAKSILNSMGVDPKSPTGKKWLQLYADQNGIVLGPKGNPVRRTRFARPATR
jgi:hypothetical protein